MPIIDVDIVKISSALLSRLPSKNDMTKALQALGAAARAEWISQASDELHSTARDYIQGIGEPQLGDNRVSITLAGALPLMIESGWPQTDLRTTILKSPRAKTSQDGHKYMAIPFRHGTPGTSGRNVGRPMPKPIHNVARHLAPTMAGSQGQRAMGERLHAGMKMGQRARTILQTKERSWHSGSIYTGMIRKVEVYGRSSGGVTTQSSYQTFRTISENVRRDARHWIHPGIKARRIIPRVQKLVAEIAPKVLADATK